MAYKTLIFVAAILLAIPLTFSQITPGVRLTNHTSYISHGAGDVRYIHSYNAFGITPFLNLETKRIIGQASYCRYFNVRKPVWFGTMRFENLYKPYEMNLQAGYKFNARKRLKIYPMIGMCKYVVNIEDNYRNAEKITKKELNSTGFTGALGIYYNIKNVIIDFQVKFSRVRGPEYTSGSMLNFGLGVGYQFGGKSEK